MLAIGKRIKQARIAKGYSTQGLANRMSVSKGTVGHWETGTNAMRIPELVMLCRLLEVSADEIIFGVRRWPFPAIDFDKVAELEPVELGRIEGGLIRQASDLGLDLVRVKSAPAEPGARNGILVVGDTPTEDADLSFGAEPHAQPHKRRGPVRKRAPKNASLRDVS